jgi:cytochrome c-type biogenesis protein CcmH/NrfG
MKLERHVSVFLCSLILLGAGFARAGVLMPDLLDVDGEVPDFRHLDPTSAVARALAEISRPRSIEERIAAARDRVMRRPMDPISLSRLGKLLLAANRLDEAIEYFWRAARLKPDDEDIVEAFGFALLAVGDHRNGVRIYEAVRQRNPSSDRALFNLASAYHQLGRTADAIPLLNEFIEKHPSHARAWHNIGVMHLERGQIGQATLALQRAIHLQPEQPFTVAVLARLHLASGRTDQYEAAQQNLRQMIGDERAEALLNQNPLPVFLIR